MRNLQFFVILALFSCSRESKVDMVCNEVMNRWVEKSASTESYSSWTYRFNHNDISYEVTCGTRYGWKFLEFTLPGSASFSDLNGDGKVNEGGNLEWMVDGYGYGTNYFVDAFASWLFGGDSVSNHEEFRQLWQKEYERAIEIVLKEFRKQK